ncbi:MAG TPA: isocitrate lyase/phosphoenolpyruvate mutase family protein, partial [Patescibacteria group bacterium]|nr:isocitrate lyase/phosphoenolpyruvate mutase family protein [Patescibacteria group bacterium]
KIQAAKDSQSDPDFVVVARVEAFIAGRNLEETLARASAYKDAGADAILIHSSRKDAAEILAFKQAWGYRLPVVIVPTTYYQTPTATFREAGFSVCIWANHQLRSALLAMQKTARQIFETQSIASVEPEVATLAEVFRLQNAAELQQAETKYLTTLNHD